LASDGGFFIFMFWYFHKGLEPHLQRAHAGHTQGVAHQPAISFSISFQHPFNRAGGRTSNVREK
jgi:hypothetical protein